MKCVGMDLFVKIEGIWGLPKMYIYFVRRFCPLYDYKVKKMRKLKGLCPFLGIALTQVAASSLLVVLLEMILTKMQLDTVKSWQFYVLHLVYLLPCVLLVTPAGFFSDKYPKEKVLKITTWLMLPAVGLLALGARLGSSVVVLVATALFFILQAFHSPARYGYLKELLGVRYLAIGSGYLMIFTFLGIFAGAIGSNFAAQKLSPVALDFPTLIQAFFPAVLVIAGVTFLAGIMTLLIPSIGKLDADIKFPWKDYFNTKHSRRKLAKAWRNKAIRQSMIGLSMFWAMIFYLLFIVQDEFSRGTILKDSLVSIPTIGMCAGLIVGFIIAMRLSRSFIETGLVPMGTAGAAVMIFIIPVVPNPYNVIPFTLLGICAGIYVLPMISMLLYHTKPRSAGHVLAVNNGIQNLVILAFDVLLLVAVGKFGIHRVNMFYLLGVVCLIGTVWSLVAMPQTLLRSMMRSVLSFHYKFAVRGLNNLPWEGPVLLVGNHVSIVDWALLQMACPRPVRVVMTKPAYEKWYIRLARMQTKFIELDINDPAKAMDEAHQALMRGEVVAVFPENTMSPTGNLSRFRLDYSAAVAGVPRVRLVPFYIHGLWGSVYSNANAGYRDHVHADDRVVSVAFGQELPLDTDAIMVRRAVQELSIEAWNAYIRRLRPVASAWIRCAKRKKNSPAVFGHDGIHYSAYAIAVGSLSLAKLLERESEGEQTIGLMFPPSAAGMMMNMAAMVRGRTVLNLNYTNAVETIDYCCKLADVKTIFTAHAFVDRLVAKGLALNEMFRDYKIVYIEDLLKQISKLTKLKNLLRVMFLPSWWIEFWDFKKVSLNDVATIIFSSGSEGRPKGVELTHFNLMGNIKQCASAFTPGPEDVFLGILPLFHSFGFTVTTMMSLVDGIPVATCPDPTDARLVANSIAKYKVTLMITTPTFLRVWGVNKNVHPLMFESIQKIYAGAEKVREDVRVLYRTKFKLEIFEGYGCSETTPVSAVNMRDTLMEDCKTVVVGNKPGTVGAPLCGTQFRIVDPDTMEELPIGQDGLIITGGNQVMKGYLKDPERTANVLVEINGHKWYKTGDKGHVDEDGYLTIVDRYSRFAKIGGEMVSLGAVDFAISGCAAFDAIDHFAVAVPDGAKGEKVALLYAGEPSEDEVKSMLKQVGLQPLMQPAYVLKMDVLPKLGSGKSDFQTGKKVAMERLGLQA